MQPHQGIFWLLTSDLTNRSRWEFMRQRMVILKNQNKAVDLFLFLQENPFKSLKLNLNIFLFPPKIHTGEEDSIVWGAASAMGLIHILLKMCTDFGYLLRSVSQMNNMVGQNWCIVLFWSSHGICRQECLEKTNDSPVLSELQSSVSFSALRPGLGPCFIHVAMVNWSVRFCGTTQSGILAAWRPSNLKIKSLSLPLSEIREAVQLVAVLGAGRRSVLPEEAPRGHCHGNK